MIQVDLVMSYGFGAGLAIAGKQGLAREPRMFVNRYFLGTVLWFGSLFVPHAMYLIVRHTAWHTMFVVSDIHELPPWVVGAYAVGNLGLGVLGFALAARSVRRGRLGTAWIHVAMSALLTLIVLTYGWDGSGYVRFLYAGTGGEWASGVEYPLNAFFGGEVFWTIAWILPAWALPYLVLALWLFRKAPSEGSSNAAAS